MSIIIQLQWEFRKILDYRKSRILFLAIVGSSRKFLEILKFSVSRITIIYFFIVEIQEIL